MGRCTGGNHAGKVSCRYGIGRGTAQPFSGIFAFNPCLGQRQTTRAHGTVLTAGTLHPDITGFHGYRSIKNRLDTQFLSMSDHFLSCRINRGRYRIRHLLRLLGLYYFFFCH
jgi:hypothetical protein